MLPEFKMDKIQRRKITPEMFELTESEIEMQKDIRKKVCQNIYLEKAYFPFVDQIGSNGPRYDKMCKLTKIFCIGESPSLKERFIDGVFEGFREIIPKEKESPLVYGLSKKIIERCQSRDYQKD